MFKKFLMSMDIILPHMSAHIFRIPAKRFGYILSVTKERYKDDSMDFADAGEKVKSLINEHLISLGINPKVAPVELLAPDFIEKLNKHAGGNNEAKASEMEHAIRKHCTVHHDEDPAFYKSLSEKVENLIDQYQDQWDALAEELEKLRNFALIGRQVDPDGMSKEAATFYDYIASVGFENGEVPDSSRNEMRQLMAKVVELLQDSIGSIDFWQNPDKQKKMRSLIKAELLTSGIKALSDNRERVAIEALKLAKNRHNELIKGQ
jgi:type I restriction enzyme R subunit